jgi:rhodanese-related sulfurtransferase
MNKYEIEFRIASLQREAQNNALLKDIRTAESAALRHALNEILGIFKHWTFGLSQVQNNANLTR